MTQILASDYLNNIREEEHVCDLSQNNQKQSEDFRNLQHIEEALAKSH